MTYKWTETPESSNIEGFGYDTMTSTLTMQFKGGVRYTYQDVPKRLVNGMRKAESVGSYFNQKIRPKYLGTKEE